MSLSRRPIVVLAALTLGLAGCGSDGGQDAGEGVDICTQLQTISEFEMESQSAAATDATDWPAMQSVLQEYGDGLSENYDPAIEVAEPDLAADLTTVRDASAQVTALVTESSTFEDYQQRTQENIDVEQFTEASDASARIDEYAKANCEFAQQTTQLEPVDPELEELPGQPTG